MLSEIIVICASGPSLCAEDISFVYKLGIPIIAVNSSWIIAPECQFIFAADDAWWKQNYLCIRSPAQRWTCSETAAQTFGINYFENTFSSTFNSGVVAILFAISLGARKIILLGYDCSLQDGVHWHGRHKGLNNPTPYCGFVE